MDLPWEKLDKVNQIKEYLKPPKIILVDRNRQQINAIERNFDETKISYHWTLNKNDMLQLHNFYKILNKMNSMKHLI